MVKISPNQKNGEGNRHINGAFTLRFCSTGFAVGRSVRKTSSWRLGGTEWRIAPRNNFMVEVLERRRSWTRYTLSRELRKSLRPQRRKRKTA